jgi:hypothetical protein
MDEARYEGLVGALCQGALDDVAWIAALKVVTRIISFSEFAVDRAESTLSDKPYLRAHDLHIAIGKGFIGKICEGINVLVVPLRVSPYETPNRVSSMTF